ncbi:MAG: hypothetical protein A2Z98_12470 [Spirochaetes bacterium GWB1_27_13]|nr:MAG: hypothetical protein A2Z98_12470 [Spirochaetes bacterium GWB1_27_13]
MLEKIIIVYITGALVSFVYFATMEKSILNEEYTNEHDGIEAFLYIICSVFWFVFWVYGIMNLFKKYK